MSLKGKTALVTGSTSGIGLGVARALAAEGADVAVNGLGEASAIEKLVSDIERDHGVKSAYFGADMRRPDEISAMVLAVEESFGALDILVNNAGIQHVDKVEDFPAGKWDDIIAINLSAPFHAIRAAVPGMKKRGWGRIVNIASVHGLVASVNKSGYVAAKHGLTGLSKVVALETAGTGITVNTICPGWVMTPLIQRQIEIIAERDGLSIEDARVKLVAEKQPSGSPARPEDIGAYAVFLCRETAAQITGANLTIDGGWTAQ
jgi:3-hydroxybutyrate dehydrogenase